MTTDYISIQPLKFNFIITATSLYSIQILKACESSPFRIVDSTLGKFFERFRPKMNIIICSESLNYNLGKGESLNKH